MDCGTSDTGQTCVAYLYEKDFPNKLIATMADLYDMSRLNALAKSKNDIDYLLSLLPQLSSSERQCGAKESDKIPPIPNENPEYQQGWVDAVEAMRAIAATVAGEVKA